MVDLLIDPDTGDLAIENNMVLLTKNNAQLTRQRIDTTLNTYRGEWVYNILEGIPYLENNNNEIQLIGKGSKEDFASYFKQAILAKPTVVSILSYESDLDIRTQKLSVRVRILAEDGQQIEINTSI